MRGSTVNPARFGSRRLSILVFLAGWLGFGTACFGQVVRVEEDWEMIVASPDSDLDAPQVACIISPFGALDPLQVTFTLNHRSKPDYAAGGMQLQLWLGDYFLFQTESPNTAIMSTPGETVSWTSSVDISGYPMVFEIANGSSSTWGPFGGDEHLKMALPGLISDLSIYDPAVSVAHSEIVYAANRVESLVIKRVRWITADGGVIEDTTPRVIHALSGD